jgi:hypothetical protein
MDGKLWDGATEKPLRKETMAWRDALSRGRKTQAPKSRIRGEDGNTQSQEERVVSDNTDNNNTQDAWRHDATDS